MLASSIISPESMGPSLANVGASTSAETDVIRAARRQQFHRREPPAPCEFTACPQFPESKGGVNALLRGNLRKVRDAGKQLIELLQQAQAVLAHGAVFRHHQHLIEEPVHGRA